MTRRARVILAALVALLVLPIAAVAVLAATFDAGRLKPRIEAAFAQVTGWTLSIAGPMHLALGWTPAIAAEDVSLANAPGGSRPEMATAHRVVLRIALLPLLHRQVVIERLDVAGLALLLETDAAGAGNWRPDRMPPARDATASAAGVPNPAGATPGVPNADEAGPALPLAKGGGRMAVALRRVDITDATLDWRDGRSGRAGSLTIPILSLTQPAAGAPVALSGTLVAGPLTAQVRARAGPPGQRAVHVELAGTVRDQPVTVTADLSGRSPVSVAVTAKAGAAGIDLAGTVAEPLRAAGVDLQVSLQVPDPAALGVLLGRPLPDIGSLSFAGRVTGDAHGTLALHGFGATGPGGDLSGDLTVVPGRVVSIGGRVSASRLDLDAMRSVWRALPAATSQATTSQAGASQAGASPATTSKAGASQAGASQAGAPPAAPPPPAVPPLPAARRLIPDTPLPFDLLRRADADVQLRIGTVMRGRIGVNDVAMHVLLTAGRLTLDPITAALPGSTLQAALIVDAGQPAPAPARVSLHLRAPGLAAKAILAGLALPRVVNGSVDVQADLRAEGRTPHALAASLDGTAGLAMDGGDIDAAVLRPALDALFGAIRLPQDVVAATGDSRVRCLAVRSDFAGGHGALRPLLLETSDVHVEGEGTVDLADETWALTLRPLARLGGTGIAVPLRVSGPLLAPRVAIDAGAVAGAAAAGGGLRALIGALDEAATTAPCAPALVAARGGALAPTPAPAPQKPGKTIDLLRRLFR